MRRTNNTPERLLTVAEVAELLAVSPRQVRRWISSDDLPAYKLGNRVRIAPAEVRRFLKAHGSMAGTGIPCLDET